MRKPSHKILAIALCAISILGAQSALAQYSTESDEASAQKTLDEINAFLDKANTAIDEGEEAENAGQYATACDSYRRAIGYNESAISAHMGYSGNQSVPYRKMSDSIDNIRRHTNNIESAAGRVCGKPDEVRSPTQPSSNSGASQGDYFDETAAAQANQATIYAAGEASRAAYSYYEAGDTAKSCESAKLAATLWQRAQSELETLIARSNNTGYDNPQLAINAAQSAEDLPYYCK